MNKKKMIKNGCVCFFKDLYLLKSKLACFFFILFFVENPLKIKLHLCEARKSCLFLHYIAKRLKEKLKLLNNK